MAKLPNMTFGDWSRGKSFTLGNVSEISFTYNEPNEKPEPPPKPKKIMKAREIKAHLDQYIIGQEEAKIALSVAVYNHYKRINTKFDDGIEIQKSNILMIGNSGSGKTLLAQTIAKILDVPFVIVDVTTFTPTGIVGKDFEDIVKDLSIAANGDRKKAEQGIVFIDEIDKIAGQTMSIETHNVKGVLGGATQSSLLKLIEGNDVETQSRSMYDSGSRLNTKNVLFICGGAFSGIEKLVQKDKCENLIGFTAENKINTYINDENVWDKIDSEEVIKYGMMPELVGRLPVIVKLKPLQEKELVDILTVPKNAIIKQYQRMLEEDGVHLEFSPEALNEIARLAVNKKVGARGLRGIVENIVSKVIFNLPDDSYMRRCVITSEHVINNIVPELNEPETIKEEKL